MFNKVQIICATLALSTLGFFATFNGANASNLSVEFRFGGHHAHQFHQFYQPRPHRYYHPPRGKVHSVCKPRRALKKARNYFRVRGAEIRKINKRRIVVRGHRYGQRVKLVFANQRGCPVKSHQIRW